MSDVILEVNNVSRTFNAGEQSLTVLKNINLTINKGEMVSIIGQSGSGKSTLMNILGCLDTPSEGTYKIHGQDTSTFNADELAKLRRESFGFIFQRYHLLGDLDAISNVEVPAVYSSEPKPSRHQRAAHLLTRLGLDTRLNHKPSQLSGGQQQRVSVARALMNGGEIILADEPTGALDSKSGEDMMALLQELHEDGHTIIIVTHDPHVAQFADRIVEIKDGEILSDKRNKPLKAVTLDADTSQNSNQKEKSNWLNVDRYTEALRMALVAMSSHRLRTFLTMLGIIIGIASVVSVVALGEGSQQAVLKNINSMGTNTIDIRPGTGFGDRRSGRVRTLTPSDASALSTLPFVDSATPMISTSDTIKYQNQAVTSTIEGVGVDYYRVKGYEIESGQWWDESSNSQLAQVAVIDANTRKELFPTKDPVGQVIFLGTLPVRIIGVTKTKTSAFGNSDSLRIWTPISTMAGRLAGQSYVDGITVRINDDAPSNAAEQAIITLLKMRHGTQDFFTINTDTIRQSIEKTTQTMTLLISAIAVISLIVGGIGVMNIMLVSVTERTREIGVRMAVGARQSDILRQFLIESVLVCLCGGIIGISLAFVIGFVFSQSGASFSMVYSMGSIIAAFLCSTLIGILFGFLPARSAAQLDPVEALARD